MANEPLDLELLWSRLQAAERKVDEYEEDGVPVATEVVRSLDDLALLLEEMGRWRKTPAYRAITGSD